MMNTYRQQPIKEEKGLVIHNGINNNNDNDKDIASGGNNKKKIVGFGNKQFSTEESEKIQALLSKNPDICTLQTRPVPGNSTVAYLQQDIQFKLANDIFGVDGWSFSIISMSQDVEVSQMGYTYYLYTAIVRITLKDGSFKDNIGTGNTRNIKELANAKKTAITDGLKRCLKLFGNAFGNQLSCTLYNSNLVSQIKSNTVNNNNNNNNNRQITPNVNNNNNNNNVTNNNNNNNNDVYRNNVLLVQVKTEDIANNGSKSNQIGLSPPKPPNTSYHPYNKNAATTSPNKPTATTSPNKSISFPTLKPPQKRQQQKAPSPVQRIIYSDDDNNDQSNIADSFSFDMNMDSSFVQ